MIVYGISIVCMRKGITAPVNLNILSIGTGALLGLPGIIVLYAAAVFLLQ
jgi:inhibitor of the pro-sigma K processing machinery